IPSNTQSSINEESEKELDSKDIKTVTMSWHSLANPDIKEREDGVGTGQLHRQGKNFIPVDEKTLLEIQKKK
ncbi:15443_t:CDS:1, partial [Entrophospora sp. SA101]